MEQDRSIVYSLADFLGVESQYYAILCGAVARDAADFAA
jgi:hypothetical protein